MYLSLSLDCPWGTVPYSALHSQNYDSVPQMPLDEYMKRWKSKFNSWTYFHLPIVLEIYFFSFWWYSCVWVHAYLYPWGYFSFISSSFIFTLAPVLQISEFLARKDSFLKKCRFLLEGTKGLNLLSNWKEEVLTQDSISSSLLWEVMWYLHLL